MFDIFQSLWGDFLSIYDGLCILLAMFLFYKVEEGYRDIAFFVLCFFVVSDVFYHYFFLDIRNAPGNGWIIFLIYNIINVSIIMKIKNMASSTVISGVLGGPPHLSVPAELPAPRLPAPGRAKHSLSRRRPSASHAGPLPAPRLW